MKVVIYCDEEEDELEDEYELWSLLNECLINYPKSVSLAIYTLNYRIRDLYFKTHVKDELKRGT